MTYDTFESSMQDGAPVELYRFARGDRAWRYTSADADVTFDGETWEAAAIQRNSIETSPEQVRNALKIEMPRELAVAELFRVAPPTDIIGVIVLRYHRGDTDSAVIWMGRMLNVQWQGARAVVSCEPVSLSFGRTGLRRLYQPGCPHVLYGTACGLDKDDHVEECEVATPMGAGFSTVDPLPEKAWAGGFIELDLDDGNVERRFVTGIANIMGVDHVGLSQPLPQLQAGDTIRIYPGCAHTVKACVDYNNLENYGGMPMMPDKNPFDGVPIY